MQKKEVADFNRVVWVVSRCGRRLNVEGVEGGLEDV